MSAPATSIRSSQRIHLQHCMNVGSVVPAKAFSLPVRTMALVSSSLSKVCSASFNSRNNAVDRALSALGRLKVTDRPLIRQQEA